ncbi:MAG: hypothetical protein KDI75_10305 [Xanthomonadales bacterium]|nr:hypothetical protein [Xanthomonadales bacterium]
MRTSTIVFLALSVLSTPVAAAEFCVTSSQQLVDALNAADSNNQDDVIRVATGDYSAPDANGFRYLANSASPEDRSLVISGGWTEFFGNPCGQQAGSAPWDTFLSGNGGRVMGIFEGSLSDITGIEISNLSFTNGDSAGEAGGLFIDMNASSGDVQIERCAFIGNHASKAAAMKLVGTQRIQLRSSLVVANTTAESGPQSSAVLISTSGDQGIYLINNTIVSNQIEAADSPMYGGAFLVANDPAKALVVNNILWENDGYDLATFGSGDFYIHNNDIGERVGSNLELLDNISVEPVYAGGLLDFTPAGDSELINAGRRPPPINPIPVPFDNNWSTGSVDFVGNPRIRGGQIDIGAYEGLPSVIFTDGFE